MVEINREKSIFDVLYSKQAFLDYEIIGLKNPQNLHFIQGVSRWFLFKHLKFWLHFIFCKIPREKVFGDVFVRKQAFLANRKWDF